MTLLISVYVHTHIYDVLRCSFNYRCDRIIWNGKGLKQLEYTRSEAKLSDHRPVKATFRAEVKALGTLKNLHNLFLSERFEHLQSHIQVSSTTDELLCKKQSSFRL